MDKIEIAQENVAECRRMIQELLDEYNCTLARGMDGVILYDNEFNYKEYL